MGLHLVGSVQGVWSRGYGAPRWEREYVKVDYFELEECMKKEEEAKRIVEELARIAE